MKPKAAKSKPRKKVKPIREEFPPIRRRVGLSGAPSRNPRHKNSGPSGAASVKGPKFAERELTRWVQEVALATLSATDPWR